MSAKPSSSQPDGAKESGTDKSSTGKREENKILKKKIIQACDWISQFGDQERKRYLRGQRQIRVRAVTNGEAPLRQQTRGVEGSRGTESESEDILQKLIEIVSVVGSLDSSLLSVSPSLSALRTLIDNALTASASDSDVSRQLSSPTFLKLVIGASDTNIEATHLLKSLLAHVSGTESGLETALGLLIQKARQDSKFSPSLCSSLVATLQSLDSDSAAKQAPLAVFDSLTSVSDTIVLIMFGEEMYSRLIRGEAERASAAVEKVLSVADDALKVTFTSNFGVETTEPLLSTATGKYQTFVDNGSPIWIKLKLADPVSLCSLELVSDKAKCFENLKVAVFGSDAGSVPTEAGGELWSTTDIAPELSQNEGGSGDTQSWRVVVNLNFQKGQSIVISRTEPAAAQSNFRFDSINVRYTESPRVDTQSADEKMAALFDLYNILVRMSGVSRHLAAELDRDDTGESVHFILSNSSSASALSDLRVTFLTSALDIFTRNLAGVEDLPSEAREALLEDQLFTKTFQPPAEVVEEVAVRVPVRKELTPGFITGPTGFRLQDSNRSAVFPNGPICLFSDVAVPFEDPASKDVIYKLTWQFRVSNNSAWAVGVCRASAPHTGIPMLFGLINGTTSISGSSSGMRNYNMHGKLITVELNIDENMFSIGVEGESTPQSFPLDPSTYPLKLGFCGHNGSNVSFVGSTGVIGGTTLAVGGGSTGTGVHSGMMRCTCGHNLGSVPHPLDPGYYHLNGSCTWTCCGQDWGVTTCTSSGSSTASLLLASPKVETKDETDDEDEEYDSAGSDAGSDADGDESAEDSKQSAKQIKSLSAVLLEIIFHEVALVLSRHIGTTFRQPSDQASSEVSREVAVAFKILELFYKHKFTKLVSDLVFTPLLYRSALIARLIVNEYSTDSSNRKSGASRTITPANALLLFKQMDDLKEYFSYSASVFLRDVGLKSPSAITASAPSAPASGSDMDTVEVLPDEYSLRQYFEQMYLAFVDNYIMSDVVVKCIFNTVDIAGPASAVSVSGSSSGSESSEGAEPSLVTDLAQYLHDRHLARRPIRGRSIRLILDTIKKSQTLKWNKSIKQDLKVIWESVLKNWLAVNVQRLIESYNSGRVDCDSVVGALDSMLHTMRGILDQELADLGVPASSVNNSIVAALSSFPPSHVGSLCTAVALSISGLLTAALANPKARGVSVVDLEDDLSRGLNVAVSFCSDELCRDFGVVYDSLLSQRLLSGSSISAQWEKIVAEKLHDVTACDKIIRYVQKLSSSVTVFNKLLLSSVDNGAVTLSPSLTSFVLDGHADSMSIYNVGWIGARLLNLPKQSADEWKLPGVLGELQQQLRRIAANQGRALVADESALALALSKSLTGNSKKKATGNEPLKNKAGVPVKLGTGSGAKLYYCSRVLGQAAIPGSDGQCGPNNGPQCNDCRGMTLDSAASSSTSTSKIATIKIAVGGRTPAETQDHIANLMDAPPSTSLMMKWCHQASTVVVEIKNFIPPTKEAVAISQGAATSSVFVLMTVAQAIVVFCLDQQGEALSRRTISSLNGMDEASVSAAVDSLAHSSLRLVSVGAGDLASLNFDALKSVQVITDVESPISILPAVVSGHSLDAESEVVIRYQLQTAESKRLAALELKRAKSGVVEEKKPTVTPFAGGHSIITTTGSVACAKCHMFGPSSQSSDLGCSVCKLCGVCCAQAGSMCSGAVKGAIASNHNLTKVSSVFGGSGSCSVCNGSFRSSKCSEHQCLACRKCAPCCARSPLCPSVATPASTGAEVSVSEEEVVEALSSSGQSVDGVWSSHIVEHVAESRAGSKEPPFFSKKAVRLLVINEFFRLRNKFSTSYRFQFIDNDPFRWKVQWIGFGSSPTLLEEFENFHGLFGYKHLEFNLYFSSSWFPAIPPVLVPIKPRIRGLSVNALSCMPSLVSSDWSSVNGVDAALAAVEDLMISHGHLDLEADVFPSSHDLPNALRSHTYSVLENQLHLLGLLTGLITQHVVASPPATATAAAESGAAESGAAESGAAESGLVGDVFGDSSSDDSSVDEAQPSATPSGAGGSGPWAKGTGYGFEGSTQWDISKYTENKASRDEIRRQLMLSLYASVQTSVIETSGTGGIGSLKNLCDVLSSSCLLPLIQTDLNDPSLVDMEAHRKTYQVLFQFLELFASVEGLNPLLRVEAGTSSKSLAAVAAAMQQSLTVYLSQKKKEKGGSKGASSSSSSGEDSFLIYVESVVRSVGERAAELEAIERAIAESAAASGGDISAAASASAPAETLDQKYKRLMTALQYADSEDLQQYKYASNLTSTSTTGSGMLKSRIKRLAQEHADLSHSLPISWSSSVWLRVSASRLDALQFMISGPEDTPYSNGLFLFDTFFDESYPSKPPHVNLQTTGRGSVRFNPNLYNCGKVCLSLLGTWPGQASESWLESQSTFLQVLVSIQSLILVSHPVFNEPGDEALLGTPEGDLRSANYNAVIREGTARFAILDQLRDPKAGFEDVIRTHFSLKRAEVQAQLATWIGLAITESQKTAMAEIATQVAAELSKLPEV